MFVKPCIASCPLLASVNFVLYQSMCGKELGLLAPERLKLSELRTGQVGYVVPGLREMADAQCGETLCSPDVMKDELSDIFEPLPGFTPAKAMVFASIYPTDAHAGSYEALTHAVDKLLLTDPRFVTDYVVFCHIRLCVFARCIHLGLLVSKTTSRYTLCSNLFLHLQCHDTTRVQSGPRPRASLRVSRFAAHGRIFSTTRARVWCRCSDHITNRAIQSASGVRRGNSH